MKKTLGLLLCAIMMLFAFTSCTDPVSIASVAADSRDILSTPENVLKTVNITYNYNEPVGRFLSEREPIDGAFTVKSWSAYQMLQYGNDDYLRMILANDISPLLKDVPFGKLVIVPEQKTYSEKTINALMETRIDLVTTKGTPEEAERNSRNNIIGELKKVQVKAIQVDKLDNDNAKVWLAVSKKNKMYFYVLYCTRNQYGIFDTTAYGYNMKLTENIGSSSTVDFIKSVDSTIYGPEYSVSYKYVEENGVETFSSRKYENGSQVRSYMREGEESTYSYFEKGLGGATMKSDGYYEFFDENYELVLFDDEFGGYFNPYACAPGTSFELNMYLFNGVRKASSFVILEYGEGPTKEEVGFTRDDLIDGTLTVVNVDMPKESSASGFYYKPDEAFRVNMADLADWAYTVNSNMKKNQK